MSVPALKMKQLKDPSRIELRPLADDPRYRAKRAELDAIETRIGQAEQRLRVAQARSRGQQPTRSAAERADDLMAGGRVVILPPAAEIEGAHEDLRILHGARITKNEELQAVASEISREACARFTALNADALRGALEATEALHMALEVGRVIRGRLVGAGYSLHETALPVHQFPAAAAVGDPNRVGMTPAALFKTWLADKGII